MSARTCRFDAIRGKHDAVLIATGVYKSRELDAPGAGAAGIVRAIDYLTASNRKSFGDEVAEFDDGTLNAKGKRVVVIGGGDTAMDCVRTAIRQGADSVKCLYRRDRANMPGSQREVQNAEEEGVEFVWLAAPKGFDGRSGHRRDRAEDAAGRARCHRPASPELIEGADYPEPADLVIKALGFEPEDAADACGARAGAGSDPLGHDPTPISRPARPASTGVYAVGDIVRGACLVVWAIRDGRDAAAAILGYLGQSASVAAE